MNETEVIEGDCLEVLRGFPNETFDAVVTDPPYTAAGGSTNGRSEGHAADSQFFLHWLRAVWDELRRVTKPTGCAFVFCDWRTVGLLGQAVSPVLASSRPVAWRVSQALVWDREGMGMGNPFRNGYEMIAFARGPDYRSTLPKDITNVIRHRWPYGGSGRVHGAQKPLELCQQLVRWACPQGGIILDPFAGSGTTIEAAVTQGYKAVGIELESSYCKVARNRVANCSALLRPEPNHTAIESQQDRYAQL